MPQCFDLQIQLVKSHINDHLLSMNSTECFALAYTSLLASGMLFAKIETETNLCHYNVMPSRTKYAYTKSTDVFHHNLKGISLKQPFNILNGHL